MYYCIDREIDNVPLLLLVVVGVEVASAKTQTSKSAGVFPVSSGSSAVPSQFVVGMFTYMGVFLCITYR